MKNKRILFLVIVFSLLLNTTTVFGEVKNNNSDVTANNNTQIESSDNKLTEALTILNENSTSLRTKPLTLEQIKLIIEEIYPEILDYIPIEDLYIWVENSKDISNLIALGNAIHEENHVYSYKAKDSSIIQLERNIDKLMIWLTYKDKYNISTMYNVDGTIYTVKPSESFNSDKIKDLIPINAKNYFYDNYIINEKSLSNQTGIFGMINEYNSYSKELEFYKKYLNYKGNHTYSSTINTLDKLLVEIENCILAYLIYAEDNCPEYYEEYMDNLELRQVYSRNKDKNEKNTSGFYIIKDSPIYEVINEGKFREMQERFYVEEEE